MLATFDHTALDRHDINLYLELGIYRRDDFEFAAVIIQKIINWFGTRIHRVTYEEYQELFDHVFGNYDWSRSFTKTQVIYSDDLITPDTLIHFHEYLRKKCVNIENIMFMICGSQGADEWWQQWCLQAREQSFRVCTWPVSESVWIKKYTNGIVEPNWDNMWQTKILNLTQLFSIYGGSYAKRDRCFLTLRLCELYDYGFVDFMGNFTNKQQLIDYTEHITYFKNQKEVDYVTDLYNQYIDSHGQLKRRDKLVNYPAVKDDKFSTDTMQWYIDQQCIFNIIRETDDSGCFG